jgi:hypothetical protein
VEHGCIIVVAAHMLIRTPFFIQRTVLGFSFQSATQRSQIFCSVVNKRWLLRVRDISTHVVHKYISTVLYVYTYYLIFLFQQDTVYRCFLIKSLYFWHVFRRNIIVTDVDSLFEKRRDLAKIFVVDL